MTAKTVLASVLGLTLTLSASGAWAGPKLVPLFGTTFRVNGLVSDSSNIGADRNRDPFVVQLFSSGNECLRIAGISQDADLEATLISPTGRTWQNDDGNGLQRPLIKAITDVRGSVHVPDVAFLEHGGERGLQRGPAANDLVELAVQPADGSERGARAGRHSSEVRCQGTEDARWR